MINNFLSRPHNKFLLWLLLGFIIFIIGMKNTYALTQCNSQGAESSQLEMPLIVFVGNDSNHGREYRFFTMDNAYGSNDAFISGSWNYNSFQKLCTQLVGSNDSTSNYITFRIANYTYLVGNVYTITFAMTDNSTFDAIQPNTVAALNLDMVQIISSRADPRDLTYYLTFSFYVTQNYSGTANFAFYSSSNLQSAFNSADWVYTPYISVTPRFVDYSSDFSSISQDTASIMSGVSAVQSQLNGVQNSVDEVNDSINDDTVDNSDYDDFFSNFTTNTFGLTSIITAPLNLIQSLTSTSCTPLQLPLPYLNNKYLTLPCMSTIYSQYFGSFFTLYQSITYGIIAYWICVRIFNLVKDFKNPEHDEIEVVDL